MLLFIFLSSQEAGSEARSQISLPAVLPRLTRSAKDHTPFLAPARALTLSPLAEKQAGRVRARKI